jgi:hypothetical protein
MIRSAFHIHTMYLDGKRSISPENLFKRLYDIGVEVPIITDKNLLPSIELRKVADRVGMHLPYGVEAMLKPKGKRDQPEIIAIFNGTDSEIERVVKNAKNYDYKEFIKFVKGKEGKVVLQHADFGRSGLGRIYGYDVLEDLCSSGDIDAIEWNLALEGYPFERYGNKRAELLLERVNRKYGLDLPLFFGNDAYWGEIGIVMDVKTDDPEEVLEKLFEGEFIQRKVRRPMPFPYYLFRHALSTVHEPKSNIPFL